jgi:hypothetical protein
MRFAFLLATFFVGAALLALVAQYLEVGSAYADTLHVLSYWGGVLALSVLYLDADALLRSQQNWKHQYELLRACIEVDRQPAEPEWHFVAGASLPFIYPGRGRV